MKYIGPFDRGKKGKQVDLRFESEAKKKKKKKNPQTQLLNIEELIYTFDVI